MVDISARITPGHLEQLRRSFRGEIVTPDDRTYDEARRLWNAVHDRRPSLIVRPTSAAEVATAVAFGREHDLEIAVQSGGHAASGLGGHEGCLVINLSAMRGVEVDPSTRSARANGGALLGELDVAAQAHGLVCPIGVIGHTGVAGLTLGGGIGRLQRHFGLTIDNLTAVEIVTADGRLVRATATDEPELFWGLRGAGSNFGIATAFEFRLQPFGPALHRGVLTFRSTQVEEIWRIFHDYAANAPDTVAAIFGIAPAGPDEGYPDDVVGRPIAYLAWNHSGPAGTTEADTAGLRVGPKPLTETIGSQPYLDVQTAHDLAFAWGERSFIKSHNANDVRAETLHALVDLVSDVPGDASVSVTALGGAIGRLDEEATAYTGRTAAFDMSADSSWTDPEQDAANQDWCRRALAAFGPLEPLGGYANGNADAGPEETHRIFGAAKVARLAALKRSWDPDNVFHVNHNIEPAPVDR